MKQFINKNKVIIFNILIISIFSWVLIANTIQAIKCPKMSQTELFLHIPKSFICNWNQCR